MLYSSIGSLKVSKIIFGSWGLGGPPFWQRQNESDSRKAIETAISVGINAIDTAPVYGFGASEILIGKAVKGKRNELVLATKFGLRWEKPALPALVKNCSPDSIEFELDESLKRLQTDRIDLYQVHWHDEKTPVEDIIAKLVEMQDKGKIVEFGVSNFGKEMLKTGLATGKIASVQPCYNMLQREIEADLLPFAYKNDVAVIPYSPLASGLLSGKYSSGQIFKDWRGNGKFGLFANKEGSLDIAYKKIDQLKEIAKGLGVSMVTLSLAWLLARDGVTSVIAGIKSADQVEEIVKAVGFVIDTSTAKELSKIID